LTQSGIQWVAGSDNGAIGVSYTVQWVYLSGGVPQSQTQSGLTNLFYTKSDMSTGTDYSLSVRADNTCGNSAFSSVVSLTAGTNPSVVTNVATSYNSLDSTVSCTWT
jgi:hypothetical protein